MEPISNADRLVALLRQKLRERGKAPPGSRASPKSGSETTAGRTSLATVRALAALDDTDDRQLRRAFIHGLLADQMGTGLVNDAQFQQVVTRVTEAIEQDPPAARLLARVIADLRT